MKQNICVQSSKYCSVPRTGLYCQDMKAGARRGGQRNGRIEQKLEKGALLTDSVALSSVSHPSVDKAFGFQIVLGKSLTSSVTSLLQPRGFFTVINRKESGYLKTAVNLHCQNCLGKRWLQNMWILRKLFSKEYGGSRPPSHLQAEF